MIAIIEGKIRSKNKNSVVVITSGGIGYEIKVSATTFLKLPAQGEIILHTYLKVSENAMDLYGFLTAEEKEFFELLISISGVGPKTALNIMAVGSIDDIQLAIGRSDVKYLTAVQGIGGKTAERMVVELKSKIQNPKSKIGEVDSEILSEVIDGLVAMGYSRDEAKNTVNGVDTKGKTTEQVLREVLRRSK
jgi:Holliday junction DNA helicase RuvA